MNKSIQGGTVPAIIWKDVMKVATEPYGNAEFNYPEVYLEPFKLDPANVRIIMQGEDYTQQNQQGEENSEDPEDSGRFRLSPQELFKNIRLNNSQQMQQIQQMQQAQPMQQVPQVQQPQPQVLPRIDAEQPTARQQVQQQPVPSAPTPIQMAVPESLN